MKPYYNDSVWGKGIEGFVDYSNSIVDGWMANLFIIVLYIVIIRLLSKSEWKWGPIISYTSFGVLLIGATIKLMTDVHELILIALALMIGVGVIVSFIENSQGT